MSTLKEKSNIFAKFHPSPLAVPIRNGLNGWVLMN